MDKRRCREDQGQSLASGRSRKAFEAAGGKITSVFMLMGQYDMAVIAEAPDDATMARVILTLASKGGIRTITHRAFTEDEYRKIISSIA